MKQYDRKAKKWITQEEYDKRYPAKKDKEICRGKKPHQWVLVLPYMVDHDERYNFDANTYYEAMDSIRTFTEEQYKRLEQLGIKTRRWHGYGERRLYVCSVCKKQDYRDK